MASIQYYDVILKPVLTEKSMAGMSEKKYTFLVHTDANKSQIKDAVKRCLQEQRLSALTPLITTESPRDVALQLVRQQQQRRQSFG